jgi:hypothetical protein
MPRTTDRGKFLVSRKITRKRKVDAISRSNSFAAANKFLIGRLTLRGIKRILRLELCCGERRFLEWRRSAAMVDRGSDSDNGMTLPGRLLRRSAVMRAGAPPFTNRVGLMFVTKLGGYDGHRLSLREGSGPDRHPPSPPMRWRSGPYSFHDRHPKSRERCSSLEAAFSRPNSGGNYAFHCNRRSRRSPLHDDRCRLPRQTLGGLRLTRSSLPEHCRDDCCCMMAAADNSTAIAHAQNLRYGPTCDWL